MSEFNSNVDDEEKTTKGWDVKISDVNSNDTNAPRIVIGNITIL